MFIGRWVRWQPCGMETWFSGNLDGSSTLSLSVHTHSQGNVSNLITLIALLKHAFTYISNTGLSSSRLTPLFLQNWAQSPKQCTHEQNTQQLKSDIPGENMNFLRQRIFISSCSVHHSTQQNVIHRGGQTAWVRSWMGACLCSHSLHTSGPETWQNMIRNPGNSCYHVLPETPCQAKEKCLPGAYLLEKDQILIHLWQICHQSRSHYFLPWVFFRKQAGYWDSRAKRIQASHISQSQAWMLPHTLILSSSSLPTHSHTAVIRIQGSRVSPSISKEDSIWLSMRKRLTVPSLRM